MDTAVSSPASRTTQPGVRRRSLTVGAATIAVTVAGVLFAVLKSNNGHDNQVSTRPDDPGTENGPPDSQVWRPDVLRI
jgi:hypothetical protein